jgi:ubiquinone/menaquinone biosynthesis C-methylase UbiE
MSEQPSAHPATPPQADQAQTGQNLKPAGVSASPPARQPEPAPTAPAKPPEPAPAAPAVPAMLAAPVAAAVPETVPVSPPDEAALEAAIKSEPGINPDNLYMFGLSEGDRARLIAQTQLFSQFLRLNAPQLVVVPVKRFLDIGCGEGQLSIVLSKVYPDSHGIGVDKDPHAVETARTKPANISGLHGELEFMVGDIEEKLPDGPFDLVYASVVFSYLKQPEKVLKLIYDVLAPGGYVWIKEVEQKTFREAIDDPIYRRILQLTYDSFSKVSAHPNLEEELPMLLLNAGFRDLHRVKESYDMSNNTLSGRIALSNVFGAFYNLRKAISMLQGMPEEEYLKMHNELTAKANALRGRITYTNILARRPQQPQ